MSGGEAAGQTGGQPGAGALDGVIVAIDGPAGSGKSSTSRAVAARLGMQYIDTGALYRAVTWWMLHHGVDVTDAAAVAQRSAAGEISCGYGAEGLVVTVDGRDVSRAIREAEVTGAVSAVSAVPEVRERLVALQREWARSASGGAVVEGRDIGTVVFPDAAVKVFLQADAEARAARRVSQQGGDAGSRDVVRAAAESLLHRDEQDSTREHSPLVAAPDAVHIDNTRLSLDQVVEQIVGLVRDAAARPAAGPQ